MSENNTEERSYIAFISYRHLPLDREAAIRIQKRIENYVIPKDLREKAGGKKLGVCFRDEDELPASSSLSDSITYALDHTQYLIVICTPDLPKSRWCLQEVSYFLKTHDRDHVLAVLADGSPEESFPEQLRFTYDDEGRELAEVEPLAANIAGADHKINNKVFKKEVTRLIAAMLGCPFDTLWQRERRAKTTRLAAAAGVVFAAMAVFLGVVLSKNAQISEQNSQISEQNGQIRDQLDQISQQKDQIEKQNTELQRQVSSVLVNTGRMQLEGFHRIDALDSALKALESGDPKIYDHNAELLLADALGAYGYEQPQYDIIYEQNTEITELAVSGDGKIFFTGDSSGVVRAISTEDTSLLWERSLNGDDTPLLCPLDNSELILCKTRSSILMLSTEDGSTVWSKDYNYYCRFYMLSPDQSVVAVLARDADYSLDVDFFDTATGKEVCHADLPLEEHELSDRGTSCYEYGGAFSADGTRFVCMIPCYRGENLEDCSAVFSADLRDGTVTPVASFNGRSNTVLGMDILDDETIYCAFTTTHTLFSALMYFDPSREAVSHTYDYSRPSATGLPGSVSEGEAGWIPALFSDGLSVLFSRNKIYLMNLSDATLRFTFDLESPVVSAQWIDRKEEFFQVVTDNGMTLLYDVTHEGNSAFDTLYGEYTQTANVKTAGFIQNGFFNNPRDGITLIVSKDAPQEVVSIRTATDSSLIPFADNDIWTQSWTARLSPSGERLFINITGTGEKILVFDTSTGQQVGEFSEPFDGIPSGMVIPDDEHYLYQGVLYSQDGSEEILSPQIAYVSPEAIPLSDGTLLFTRDIPVNYGTEWRPEVRVFSYQYGDDKEHQHYNLQNGICMKQEDPYSNDRTYLFAAGKCGWLAGYGFYTYVDDDHVQQTTETPVLVVQNAATGDKKILDYTYDGQAVTRLTFADRSPLLAAETDDGKILLYDLETGAGRILTELYAYGEIDSLCFSDQSDLLFVYTKTGRLDCYDLKTGLPAGSFEKPFSAGLDITGLKWLSAVRMADGRILMSGGQYADHGWAAVLDTEAWVLAARIDNFYGWLESKDSVLIKTDQRLSSCPIHTLEDLQKRAEALVR